ncbi:arginase [Tumebacillus algifaecis]|uniref:Arginase n=1 Tax=Tumebacillus algifaecis TaxID=1214604 RepID=A0A223CXN5_9BACL|nr:arginase [Tumebacillus algifaecis]ASS73957.1 arginase [Tumebacillus algifaecis]
MDKTVSIIGVPMDLGQGRRGVDMGPYAIRYANIKERIERLGRTVKDQGNINVPTAETETIENQKLKYLPEVARVSEDLAAKVGDVVRQGHFPIILGGDHSISIGSIAGVTQHIKKLGVIWFDAHGDMNTEETTPSGNIHGMPLATCIGVGNEQLVNIGGFAPKLRPQNVVIVGARSIDPEERELIKQHGITCYTMHEIDKLGIAKVMEEAIRIASDGTDGIHLSLDLDSIDPDMCPGVGTPVLGGVTYREGHLAMEMLFQSDKVVSCDLVEVNPILDEHNKTARTAVDLVCSLLGESVM